MSCTVPFKEFRAALLQATNEARAKGLQCGSEFYPSVAPLIWNGKMSRAARNHSRDMAFNNVFSHTGSDGLQVWDRVRGLGYPYTRVGENIAAGYTNVAAVQAGWESSEGHCRNMMRSEYKEMGAACVTLPGSTYQRYWTVVFGRRNWP